MTDFLTFAIQALGRAFGLLDVQVFGIPIWSIPVGVFVLSRIANMMYNRKG